MDDLDSSLAQSGGESQRSELAPKFWRARDLKRFKQVSNCQPWVYDIPTAYRLCSTAIPQYVRADLRFCRCELHSVR